MLTYLKKKSEFVTLAASNAAYWQVHMANVLLRIQSVLLFIFRFLLTPHTRKQWLAYQWLYESHSLINHGLDTSMPSCTKRNLLETEWQLNHYSPAVTMCITMLNVLNFGILPPESIYVFCMDPRTHRDCFLQKH